MYQILTPCTKTELDKYYECRWRLLREPWNESKGTERDDIEDISIHRMAVINEQVIAVGRLHFINKETAQIRYMGVINEYENKGVGKAIYSSLEQEAHNKNIKLIILNAREMAIGFYEKLGFTLTRKTYLLFNEIQHYEMQKHL